jgi:hypothetical protein
MSISGVGLVLAVVLASEVRLVPAKELVSAKDPVSLVGCSVLGANGLGWRDAVSIRREELAWLPGGSGLLAGTWDLACSSAVESCGVREGALAIKA